MAKKFGKFLLGMAALGGAAAAAYYYLQKKNAISLTPESIDEDYDDFSDEPEETATRNYVQLNTEPMEETACQEEGCEEMPSETADAEPPVEEAVIEETVEEFFDEAAAPQE